MKTLLLSLSLVFFSGLVFSQTKREKELYNTFEKSAFKKYWGDGDFNKKSSLHVAKFYSCLEKNYKINPYKYAEFTSVKDFEKKYPNKSDIEKNDILKENSLYYKTYGILDYQRRISSYESFPKCVKKSDVDW
ncbi:hypothetical protein HZP35_18925 [Elizabethkingia anophelis]|nr:hypothetical protein [Elizabethkingia anophelis]MCT4171333.1 hypothetical protein [Elizabethkingia anophelis]MCT4245747.1 hypothetical protein [Elizabethkingia anophelis]MCT4249451.1 hypothetical protein [Elizabethkingia anophelis]MCT4260471.1 hypothetical protein [Elizabethkingia anophelis]